MVNQLIGQSVSLNFCWLLPVTPWYLMSQGISVIETSHSSLQRPDEPTIQGRSTHIGDI